MSVIELVLRAAVAVLIIGLPIWLIVRLVDRIRPKKPDEWDNVV